MRYLVILAVALVLSCGDTGTRPASVVFLYRETQLPNAQLQPVSVLEVRAWTFEDGQYYVRRKVLTSHAGTLLPANQSLLFWAGGIQPPPSG